MGVSLKLCCNLWLLKVAANQPQGPPYQGEDIVIFTFLHLIYRDQFDFLN